MAKVFWIGSVALLLSAPMARADNDAEAPEVKGPVRVEVRGAPSATGEKSAAVEVYVQEAVRPGGRIRVEAATDGAGPIQWEGKRTVTVVGEPVKLGEYWLGLGCSPARGALRTQLDLPEGRGLVVEHVADDSPAAAAKIRQHDVLLKAGDKPLATVQDLVDAVEAAKETELPIALIRGAKAIEIAVTPAKRPKEAPAEDPQLKAADEAREIYQRLLDGLEKTGGADEAVKRAMESLKRLQREERPRGSIRWKFLGPGAILPHGPWPSAPLPENMSISISKQGDEPAQIKVRQGDQKWEVNEGELDKLPKNVREHVERMLGRVVDGETDRLKRFEFTPDRSAPTIQQPRPESRLEKRLEEMNRRIEQLRKSIEQLRENRPRLRKGRETDRDDA